MIKLTPPQARMLRAAHDGVKVSIVTAKISGGDVYLAKAKASDMLRVLCVGLGQGMDEEHGRLGHYDWATLQLENYDQQPVAQVAAQPKEEPTHVPAKRRRGRPPGKAARKAS